MDAPEVSVVIPLYNKERHIERALRSVCSQSLRELEVIVIDDGSTDDGAEIVKNYIEQYEEGRIQLIKQKNAGVAAARNAGIERATAEMVAFLDADDEWQPGFLEKISQLREAYPQAGAYVTAYEVIQENGERRKPKLKALPSPPWEGLISNYFQTCALGDPPISSSSICVPKSVFYQVGFFPEGEQLGEDLDMWARIAFKYKIAFSWKIAVTYYQNAENRIPRVNDKESPIIITAKRALNNDEVQSDMTYYLKEYIVRIQLAMAKDSIFNNERKKAKKIIDNCETKLFIKNKIYLKILAMMPIELVAIMRCLKHNLNKVNFKWFQ